MPDVGSDALGDFATAYRIFDRVGMSIFADPHLAHERPCSLPCPAPASAAAWSWLEAVKVGEVRYLLRS